MSAEHDKIFEEAKIERRDWRAIEELTEAERQSEKIDENEIIAPQNKEKKEK